MPNLGFYRTAFCSIVATFLISSAPFAVPAHAQGRNLFVPYARHAETGALRDMPTTMESLSAPRVIHEPLPLPPLKGTPNVAFDAVEQTVGGAGTATPVFGLNFEGEGIDDGALGGDPSDSNGSVGATQYVEWINTSIAIFNKSTGTLVAGPIAGDKLFAALGGDCASTNDGDPIALYDKFAKRWILAQFSVVNGSTTHPYRECVAVSASSDATGSYHLYEFSYGDFNDYPKIGIWADKFLATFNFFQASAKPISQGGSPGNFVAGVMCAWERTSMEAGNAANQACVADANDFGILPSDIDGLAPPPSTEHGFFLALNSFSSLALWSVNSVNFSTGSLTLNAPKMLSIASFSFACGGGACIPQAGTSQQLDSLGDRLMYRLAYRNFGSHDSLVTNHSVAASSSTGVRWYEIRNPGSSPAVYQQGTYAPDANFRWMASVAMDHSGNMAMGYSKSSSGTEPSIYIAARAPSDALGTMGTENLIVTGTGANTGDDRWGDYSAMSVDPVDDCIFWYNDQYLKVTGEFKWNTRINNFQIKGCGAKASITSPKPGASIVGHSATFKWSGGVNVSDYGLWIGTTGVGSSNLDKINAGTATSKSVSNLPATGKTIYVRLLSTVGGVLQSNDYKYVSKP